MSLHYVSPGYFHNLSDIAQRINPGEVWLVMSGDKKV